MRQTYCIVATGPVHHTKDNRSAAVSLYRLFHTRQVPPSREAGSLSERQKRRRGRRMQNLRVDTCSLSLSICWQTSNLGLVRPSSHGVSFCHIDPRQRPQPHCSRKTCVSSAKFFSFDILYFKHRPQGFLHSGTNHLGNQDKKDFLEAADQIDPSPQSATTKSANGAASSARRHRTDFQELAYDASIVCKGSPFMDLAASG